MGARNEIRVLDRYPIIVVEFEGFPDDAQFAAYLAALDEISARQAQFNFGNVDARAVIVFDTTGSTRPITASQRKMQAAYVRRTWEQVPEHASVRSAVCFVITNAIVRGVLTAVLWLQPMREVHKIFATRLEADQWCRRWVLGTNTEPPRV